MIRSVPLRPGTWPVFCVAVLAADAGPLCADASEEGAGLSGAGDDAAVGNEATCLNRPGEPEAQVDVWPTLVRAAF